MPRVFDVLDNLDCNDAIKHCAEIVGKSLIEIYLEKIDLAMEPEIFGHKIARGRHETKILQPQAHGARSGSQVQNAGSRPQ